MIENVITPILPALYFFTSCTNRTDHSLDAEIKEIENSLITVIQINGDPPVKYTLGERMEHYKVPGLSNAVIKDRKLRWAKGFGKATPS